MSAVDMSSEEFHAQLQAHLESESAKPLQEQVHGLQASVMLLALGFLRQTRIIEGLTARLEAGGQTGVRNPVTEPGTPAKQG